MAVNVGNGSSVQFWHDRWCEVGVLKRVFPRLFTLSLQKSLRVSQMGSWHESSWSWHLIWRRNLYDWEIDQVDRLKSSIQLIMPDRDTEDCVIWKPSGSMLYPTKYIGAKMIQDRQPILSNATIKLVWHKFIPPRAQLTVWFASPERLKTADFLVEKGIIAPQRGTCPFCNTEVESNPHILFSCDFAWRTWMEIVKWWGISAVFQNRCSMFGIEWMGLLKGKNRHKLWGLVFGCVIWSIWYERNKIKFENCPINMHRFDYSLKSRIGVWAKEYLGLTVIPPHGVSASLGIYL